MLEDPEPLFARTIALAKLIDAKWKSVTLPDSIKMRFAELWNQSIHYPAEIAKGQIKLFTSNDNAEYITDAPLAKAICTYPLRIMLHEYRATAIRIANENNIDSFEEEFKDKRVSPPPSWEQWGIAIKNSNLTEVEKERLTTFLCNATTFHEIKGIAREDFSAPALIKSIGHRVDRFGIADQIAFAANQELYDKVVVFVESRTTGFYAAFRFGSLNKEFEEALFDTGFKV